ncbi:hypothetical protein Cgig2_000600 [Carnegiea gigantea]|uniref:Uncharacterized protein n=1 Tax=Carnegiea gigantea TaxID=171969 RepID=A0A9Q1JII2_9CARY|nr:hypothetical protein Cgig2_000600 [Carnegiea gigantea]
MLIDTDHVIEPGPKVFKRKQEDARLGTSKTHVSVRLKEEDNTWRFSGGPPKSQASIDEFHASFLDNGLYNLGFSGHEFTWCNYQENGTVVEERLDHFCADTEWSLLFPNALVCHVDFDMSDHLPILLQCSPRINEKKDRQKRFMFEDMWFSDPSCKETLLPMLDLLRIITIPFGEQYGDVKSILTFSCLDGELRRSGGNRVAHDLAHRQAFSLEGEIWEFEVPEHVLARGCETTEPISGNYSCRTEG